MFRDHAAPLRRDDGSGPPGRSPEPKERSGIHVNIRPEERKLCLLVMIGFWSALDEVFAGRGALRAGVLAG
ncbi:hypothetical protein [Microbispora bryophytorum]|uniref:Uncharacterized protein n=1 Tax=Microbispora bryophytorum TaxID=1460882 RepID=A0A8H9LBH4_9ACTN|nr:hypothetical protein [Microbispora bryophytorum]MBD3138928.1 hypothetical protein [Microbispora bryophytorum]TQS10180.1 hypothetical protein FLX07_03985 [Microbispora bryophytorum]GGO00955.1 hypothetical protein GCM10011574_08220 [Microbispora bryophytorum]